MSNRGPCVKVRLIRPNGEIAFTDDFVTSMEAELRYTRLVEVCTKDLWFGARVQCLDTVGGIVHERIISN
jgi:hypothetical protein